jgi:hypothetical protein
MCYKVCITIHPEVLFSILEACESMKNGRNSNKWKKVYNRIRSNFVFIFVIYLTILFVVVLTSFIFSAGRTLVNTLKRRCMYVAQTIYSVGWWDDWYVKDWKACVRQQWYPNLRYNLSIFHEGLQKAKRKPPSEWLVSELWFESGTSWIRRRSVKTYSGTSGVVHFTSADLDLSAVVTYYFRPQFGSLLSLISFLWLGSISLAYTFLVIFKYTENIKNCGMTCL